MYKENLTLNNLQWLICHRTKPNTCFSAEGDNECSEYVIKQSDGEVPVMLELWGVQCTPTLLSLQGLLWTGVIAPDRVLSMGQIELNCVFMLN